MSPTRNSSERKQERSSGGDYDKSLHDDHEENQHNDGEEKREQEPQRAIPNYSENQVGIPSQTLTNNPLSIENQALMRILQVHHIPERHQRCLRSDIVTNLNESTQDSTGMIRGLLGLDQTLPQALPLDLQNHQQLLVHRSRNARLGLDYSWQGNNQRLLSSAIFTVPQNNQLQPSFLASLIHTIDEEQTTTRLQAFRRAALAGAPNHKDHVPGIITSANAALSLSATTTSPLQNLPLIERQNSRQNTLSDTSQLSHLRLRHEGIRPLHHNNSSFSSHTDRLPVGGPESFPMILHHALMALENTPGGESIAAFLPDGLSFRIQNREKFEEQVLAAFFPRMKGYSSFQRQLNLYGFKRCMDGRYWHERFARHDPALLTEMRREKVKRKRPRGKPQTHNNNL